MKMMKTLSMLVLALTCAIACSSSSSPADVAMDATKCIQKGSYDKIADYIYVSPGTSAEEAEQGRAMITGMMKDKGGKQIEAMGGISSYTLVSEEISEDGAEANVKINIVYGNGTEDVNDMDLILGEDGKWYLDISK